MRVKPPAATSSRNCWYVPSARPGRAPSDRKFLFLLGAIALLGLISALPTPAPLERGGNVIPLTATGKTCLAIMAFAVETDVPGINVNTLGVILLIVGFVVTLYSLLFWSPLTPWGRRRVAARRRLVGLEDPVEIVEERPLDDGLP